MSTTDDNHSEKGYQDEETLRQLHHEEGLSTVDISNRFDVSQPAIVYWMEKHNIETRGRSEAVKITFENDGPKLTLYTDHGYVRVRHSYNDEREIIRIHRLAAVAEHGFDAVANKEVHHKNGIRCDNSRENLEPLTTSEHRVQHSENALDAPYKSEDTLRRLYHDEGLSLHDIADRFDVSYGTIIRHMDKHDIERRTRSEGRQLAREKDSQTVQTTLMAHDD